TTQEKPGQTQITQDNSGQPRKQQPLSKSRIAQFQVQCHVKDTHNTLNIPVLRDGVGEGLLEVGLDRFIVDRPSCLCVRTCSCPLVCTATLLISSPSAHHLRWIQHWCSRCVCWPCLRRFRPGSGPVCCPRWGWRLPESSISGRCSRDTGCCQGSDTASRGSESNYAEMKAGVNVAYLDMQLSHTGLVVLAAVWHPADTPCLAYFCLVTLPDTMLPASEELYVEVTKYNPPFQSEEELHKTRLVLPRVKGPAAYLYNEELVYTCTTGAGRSGLPEEKLTFNSSSDRIRGGGVCADLPFVFSHIPYGLVAMVPRESTSILPETMEDSLCASLAGPGPEEPRDGGPEDYGRALFRRRRGRGRRGAESDRPGPNGRLPHLRSSLG
ncbi:nuclear pore complex protein Nup133-like, partial [Silurus meridionalis]|uniref:nuclear pore complex protein Nup133-like n=1 Tax=Silurus meridionalis TaxID=175797 RepID=UPI001EEC545E